MSYFLATLIIVAVLRAIKHWLDDHPKVPDTPASLVNS